MAQLEALRPIPCNQGDSELNLQSFEGILGFSASRKAFGLLFNPCRLVDGPVDLLRKWASELQGKLSWAACEDR